MRRGGGSLFRRPWPASGPRRTGGRGRSSAAVGSCRAGCGRWDLRPGGWTVRHGDNRQCSGDAGGMRRCGASDMIGTGSGVRRCGFPSPVSKRSLLMPRRRGSPRALRGLAISPSRPPWEQQAGGRPPERRRRFAGFSWGLGCAQAGYVIWSPAGPWVWGKRPAGAAGLAVSHAPSPAGRYSDYRTWIPPVPACPQGFEPLQVMGSRVPSPLHLPASLACPAAVPWQPVLLQSHEDPDRPGMSQVRHGQWVGERFWVEMGRRRRE